MQRPGDRDRPSVICAACGQKVVRSNAREYDKFGDRWQRAEKEFEYLCKPCHRSHCHRPRRGLEALLTEIGAGHVDQETFLSRFEAANREQSETPDES